MSEGPFFTKHEDAYRHARERANSLGVPHGIGRWFDPCAGKRGFLVRMIPGPGHRYGWDAACEAVEPDPPWRVTS